MALVVFTFVMSIGLIFKVSELLVRGVWWQPILQLLLGAVPALLALSIPVSLITSSLLVFGRLSADGEVLAMRASGISIEQMAAGPLLVGLVLTGVCIYINQDLVPRDNYRRREIRNMVTTVSPLEMLEEGTFIRDFAGLTIYIGRKEGDRLADVRISDSRERGFRRELRARTGRARMSGDGNTLDLQLFDVMVDPFSKDVQDALFCKSWSLPISTVRDQRRHEKREKDLTLTELLDRMVRADVVYRELPADQRGQERMNLAVEMNTRLALSFSCFSFVLLGIPLGIRAHRKESTVGVALSLLLVFSFYLFVIAAQSLARRPICRPDLIVWLPVLLSMFGGIRLIRRNE